MFSNKLPTEYICNRMLLFHFSIWFFCACTPFHNILNSMLLTWQAMQGLSSANFQRLSLSPLWGAHDLLGTALPCCDFIFIHFVTMVITIKSGYSICLIVSHGLIFFHHFMWLTIKSSLYFLFFTSSKGIVFPWLHFFGQTLFSHSILFSIMCTSIARRIMMNRKQ